MGKAVKSIVRVVAGIATGGATEAAYYQPKAANAAAKANAAATTLAAEQAASAQRLQAEQLQRQSETAAAQDKASETAKDLLSANVDETPDVTLGGGTIGGTSSATTQSRRRKAFQTGASSGINI